MAPSLPDSAARCVAQGAGRIVIVPFFVLPGNHVVRDIPEQVKALRMRYPSVDFAVTGHVGGHPLMMTIVEDLVNHSNAECGTRHAE
jgi:sirohydrochlorin ferrochelatase